MDERKCAKKVMDEMRCELENLIISETTEDKELIINMSQKLDDVIVQYIKLSKGDHSQ